MWRAIYFVGGVQFLIAEFVKFGYHLLSVDLFVPLEEELN